MREEWSLLPCGDYMISNYGRLYSFYRVVPFGNRYRVCGGRILKPRKHNGGYLSYTVGRKTQALAHRLVAEAFLGDSRGKATVNHIDGNKTNNRADNLEWATQQENVQHSYQTGLTSRRKPVECIETGEVYESLAAAARAIGQNASSLDSMLAGKRPTFGGYTWRYADKEKANG